MTPQPRFWSRPLGLGDATHGDGLPLPAVKAKDPVGFRHRKPPLAIGDLPAALLTLADVGPLARGCEGGELLGGEASRRSRRGFRYRGWCWNLHGTISGADQLQV